MSLRILLFIFLCLSILGCGSEDDYKNPIKIDPDALVNLTIIHSLRIPHHWIMIQIKQGEEGYMLLSDTMPLPYHGRFNKFHQETNVSIENYAHLNELLSEIKWDEFTQEDAIGLDGTSWTLKAIGKNEAKEATIWCPDEDTEGRGLGSFFSASKYLLDLGGIDYQSLTPKREKN